MAFVIRALSWLSQHATRVMAGSICLGLLLPPLAAFFAPYLTLSVIWLLTFSVARTPPGDLVHHFRHPGQAISILVWIYIALSLVGVFALPFAPDEIRDEIALNLSAPPLVATAAVAYMLRGDGAMALFITFITSVLSPLLMPMTASLLYDVTLPIDRMTMTLRLAMIVGSAFIAGSMIRRLLGENLANQHKDVLSGLTVVGLMIFGFAVMDGVLAFLVSHPDFAIKTLLSLIILNAGLQLLTYVACRWLDDSVRIAAMLLAGNRNVGLILAGMGASASIEMISYVGLAQLPIFMLPMIQAWIFRKRL